MPIIRPEDLGQFVTDALDKQRKQIHHGMVTAAHLSRTWIITTRIPSYKYPPVHTGRYRAGWHVEVLPEMVTLYNAVPYAATIEAGIKPHKEAPAGFDRKGNPRPSANLIRWAYLKLARGQYRHAQAYLLARSIAKKHWERGRAGLHVMTGPLTRDAIRRITEDEIRRALV